MLKLDHLTVVAPTLAEGVVHLRECLGLDIPFGQRHAYMGTWNHLLQLGDGVYLEVIALDPDAEPPPRTRWFGLDNRQAVKRDWDDGRRLRGWVARTDDIDNLAASHGSIFGQKVTLPWASPSFDFTIPEDGSLPSQALRRRSLIAAERFVRWQPSLISGRSFSDSRSSNLMQQPCPSSTGKSPSTVPRKSGAAASFATRH